MHSKISSLKINNDINGMHHLSLFWTGFSGKIIEILQTYKFFAKDMSNLKHNFAKLIKPSMERTMSACVILRAHNPITLPNWAALLNESAGLIRRRLMQSHYDWLRLHLHFNYVRLWDFSSSVIPNWVPIYWRRHTTKI